MKKHTMTIALAAVLLSISVAQASEFSGAWLGGKIGSNRSDVTGALAASGKNATTYGVEGGYNWDINNFLLGVDGFADFNQKATHATLPAALVNYGSDVYGLDVKLGLPNGNWLPYAKLGYANARATGALVGNGNGAHLGLGVEYKFAPHWSVAGEYSTNSAKSNAIKLNNDNFTIGINYYFNEPYVAPVAAVAEAPVVHAEAPVVKTPPQAPAVVAPPPVSETWKTLLENKPVCIDGANFEFDSAKLRGGSIKKLDEVMGFADKYQDAKLEVDGHADSTGTREYNQKLSERRAESVKAYLVNKGVTAARISTRGYGEDKPVADNKTAEGRAQNRRVEVCSVIKVEKKVRATE